jgi:hypothetical protein
MIRSAGRAILLTSFLAFLLSCGDQSPFMSLKGSATDMQITSVSDGQVVSSSSTSVPLMVSAPGAEAGKDLEIDVTLTSPTGESVWHNRTAATANEQSSVALPSGLAAGLYRLDFILYSSGEVVQKKSSSFFVASDAEGWKITGIKSFPPVITAAATVMLKAELLVPSGSNPYLRWSWKGKVIARGTESAGLGQILWTAPSDEGVYTILLEMFPSAPAAGTDFPFTSSLSLSTDIFVSGSKVLGTGDLAPEASYYSLLHLQANLADAGAGARRSARTNAVAVGSPEVVTLDNSFGYRLDGTTGISIPWFALPGDSSGLKPFTISMGITFDDIAKAAAIVTAATSDSSILLTIVMNQHTAAPEAGISVNAGPAVIIPWSGAALSPRQRYLISLSIVPQGSRLSAQWFLDGEQVSSATVNVSVPTVKQEGAVVIGGASGFSGIVDEFGVYYQEPAGRPSTDPGLYATAQAVRWGSGLVFADGFDGVYLSSGFSVEGQGNLDAGVLSLPAGSWLTLPGVRPGGYAVTVTAGLASGSSRTARLQLQWEGGTQPPVQADIIAGSTGIKLEIAADGLSVSIMTEAGRKSIALPPPTGENANLLVKIGNPADAAGQLSLSEVLAVREKP